MNEVRGVRTMKDNKREKEKVKEKEEEEQQVKGWVNDNNNNIEPPRRTNEWDSM
ncbi:hypothetical protein WUBG_10801, partial [Wuchereria bancrofti]